jgi:phosphatidylglycerol:prolipoprotein diacylglycerol transferase
VLQTLFHIPREIGGYPVFGVGLALGLWAVLSLALLVHLVRRQGLNADTWSYVPLLALIGAAIVWVIPAVSDAEGLPIRGYGMMLLLAIASATGLLAWRARRAGLDPEIALSILFWAFVPGIIGARAFYVIEYWPDFHKPTLPQTIGAVLNVAQGGLVVYGSFLAGLVGVIASAVKQRMPLLAVADLVAAPATLGLALGRVGCMLNGCCFGGHCDLPWAVHFPWGSPAHVRQVQTGELYLHGLKFASEPGATVIADVEPGSQAEQAGLRKGMQVVAINGNRIDTADTARAVLFGVHEAGMPVSVVTRPGDAPHRWVFTGPLPRSGPVHPTQIYGAINGLILTLLLLAFDPFRRRDGELIALALTLYPLNRFMLEAIRTDEAAIFGTGMSISQNVSVLVLLGVIGLWFYILRQPPGVTFGGPDKVQG